MAGRPEASRSPYLGHTFWPSLRVTPGAVQPPSPPPDTWVPVLRVAGSPPAPFSMAPTPTVPSRRAVRDPRRRAKSGRPHASFPLPGRMAPKLYHHAPGLSLPMWDGMSPSTVGATSSSFSVLGRLPTPRAVVS